MVGRWELSKSARWDYKADWLLDAPLIFFFWQTFMKIFSRLDNPRKGSFTLEHKHHCCHFWPDQQSAWTQLEEGTNSMHAQTSDFRLGEVKSLVDTY